MMTETLLQNAEQATAHLPGVVQITLWSGKGKASSALLSADKTVSNSAIGKVNGLRDAGSCYVRH